MSITGKTRKILWGRSGNRCAYCKCLLVLDGTSQDEDAIIGEECHIVAERPKGPRGASDINPSERDHYRNLILLCRNHHRMVDDQRETYTIQLLTRLKADHEKWVTETLEPSRKANQPIQYTRLPLISDAKEIVQILSNADSLHTDCPTAENEHELSLIKDLVGDFEGLSVPSDDLVYVTEATFRLTTTLHGLDMCGYYLYGKATKGKLTLQNSEEMEWRHGFIVIKKIRIPEITIGYDPHFRF